MFRYIFKLVVILVVIGFIPLDSFATSWSTPFLVSDDPYRPWHHAITVDKMNRVWVVWSSDDTLHASNLYARYHNVDGWSETMIVVEDSCSIWEPQVAVDSLNNVWIVWTRYCWQDATWRIYSCYYDGTAWRPVEQVDPDTGWVHAPSITVTPSGEIWVAYMHGSMPYGGYFRTVVSRREEGGWSAPTIISGAESLVWIPYNTDICPDGAGGMWAAWLRACAAFPDDTVKVMASYYDGEKWGEPVLVSTDIDANEACYGIKFAADSLGRVWGCYFHTGSIPFYRIRVNYADGDTWASNPMTAVLSDTIFHQFPDITIDDSGKIWVVWDGDTLVFSTYYDGKVWSKPTLVSIEPVIRGAKPIIAKDNSGRIWSAWVSFINGEREIYVNYCDAIGVEESPMRREGSGIKLFLITPNPFTVRTSINFSSVFDNTVSLKIYDIAGRLVRTIMSGNRNAGDYTYCWDGRDDKGTRVGSGVYFCHLQIGEENAIKKVIRLR